MRSVAEAVEQRHAARANVGKNWPTVLTLHVELLKGGNRVIERDGGFCPESLVRHGKGALLQWEEDIPPGSCCSNRKQPERSLLVTAVVEASGAKGP